MSARGDSLREEGVYESSERRVSAIGGECLQEESVCQRRRGRRGIYTFPVLSADITSLLTSVSTNGSAPFFPDTSCDWPNSRCGLIEWMNITYLLLVIITE